MRKSLFVADSEDTAVTLIEAKNKGISTDWQLNGLSKLSFGFTAQRRINICIAQIQNAPQGYRAMRNVDVTIVNDTLAKFSIAETNRWFPVKATGQLKALSDTSTIVSGDIYQKASLLDWALMIFLITLAMIIIEAIGLGSGILGVLWLVGFALLIVRERRSRVFRMLTEIRRLLDPNLAQFVPQKGLR